MAAITTPEIFSNPAIMLSHAVLVYVFLPDRQREILPLFSALFTLFLVCFVHLAIPVAVTFFKTELAKIRRSSSNVLGDECSEVTCPSLRFSDAAVAAEFESFQISRRGVVKDSVSLVMTAVSAVRLSQKTADCPGRWVHILIWTLMAWRILKVTWRRRSTTAQDILSLIDMLLLVAVHWSSWLLHEKDRCLVQPSLLKSELTFIVITLSKSVAMVVLCDTSFTFTPLVYAVVVLDITFYLAHVLASNWEEFRSSWAAMEGSPAEWWMVAPALCFLPSLAVCTVSYIVKQKLVCHELRLFLEHVRPGHAHSVR